MYSWPSVSSASALMDLTNLGSKLFSPQKRSYAVDGMYYVVCVCIEHVHTFIFLSLFPKQYSITSIYITFSLYEIL